MNATSDGNVHALHERWRARGTARSTASAAGTTSDIQTPVTMTTSIGIDAADKPVNEDGRETDAKEGSSRDDLLISDPSLNNRMEYDIYYYYKNESSAWNISNSSGGSTETWRQEYNTPYNVTESLSDTSVTNLSYFVFPPDASWNLSTTAVELIPTHSPDVIPPSLVTILSLNGTIEMVSNLSVTTAAASCPSSEGSLTCWPQEGHLDPSTPEVMYNWWFLLVIVFLIAGGLGNVLVCVSICLERRLQNMTNYFLLSLAVADLLVSMVVMPFGIVLGFAGHWPLGAAMCNVYVTCDVLACSSSIMHMCFISIGRYLGIRNPLKTRHPSKKMVVLKIVLVWLLSMVITSPITLLGLTDPDNIVPAPHTCSINNRFFFIFGSLFAFYIPMVFMVVSYVLTVQLLRKQAKFGDMPHTRRVHITRRTKACSPIDWGCPPSSQSISQHQSHHQHRQYSFRSTASYRSSSSSAESAGGGSVYSHNYGGSSNTTNNNGHLVYSNHQNYHQLRHHCNRNQYQSPRGAHVCDQGTQTHGSSSRSGSTGQEYSPFHRNQEQSNRSKSMASLHFKFFPNRHRRSIKGSTTVATEQKATKVLGIVFFTFVICWTPFFLLNIIFAACPTCPVSDRIVMTCLWLGYVSSTINPIIYTIFNRTFREAFIKLLTCKCVFRRKQVRAFSATDSLAQTPIKILDCMRTASLPPSFDSRDSVSVSMC